MSDGSECPLCWGCECNVPVKNGYHEEETNVPGNVYVYPCLAVKDENRGKIPQYGYAPDEEDLS